MCIGKGYPSPNFPGIFLTPFATAQSTQWCDSTNGICYQRTTDATTSVSFGIVMPPLSSGSAANSTEFIGEIIAPASYGWTGISIGGGMTTSLLLVTWPNGKTPVLSARWTAGFVQPGVYAGPTLTILKDSVVNSTHLKTSFRCQNCTSWTGGALNLGSSGSGMNFAISTKTPVDDPSNPASTFNQHDTTGGFTMNVAAAHSSSYTLYLNGVLPTSVPTTTSAAKTTTAPAPTGTGICKNAANPVHKLNVANGYTAGTIAGGLKTPRGIVFDSAGNFLFVQSGVGISGFKMDSTGCVKSSASVTIVTNANFNHGIALSPDGKTLFASSVDVLYSWTYDAATLTATNQKTIVNSMSNADHVTRTILNPVHNPTLLVVTRGSNDNLDLGSYLSSSGRAMIKVFDLTQVPSGGYNYASAGKILAYGTRNEVGIVEDNSGMIWGVENSADNLVRNVGGVSTDVHIGNPAEKLNFFGSPASPAGSWYGYPYCFMVWTPSVFKDKTFKVGDMFVQAPNSTFNDASCNAAHKPNMLFPPHTAPLDMKFGLASDTNAYVTLHGSWDTTPPVGYKVVIVPGTVSSKGAWANKAGVTSTTGFTDLLWNSDLTKCPNGCFRPVGMAWSKAGDLYVSSDTSGEILIIRKLATKANNITPAAAFNTLL
ncbi:hypothetical protein BD410DRAFT_824977 [Rickenella mellea]|uniref:Uncharacterized protein n=1 Tax=Rickenella mellea TaxID=50990 RepID=A0A4Y7QK53_9AGAM|nr:hypothetical protein BD410DRAFT_824977 [Rickenella mellea]